MKPLSIMRIVKGAATMLFIGIIMSCQKDLYNDNGSNGSQIPSPDSYFDFKLRGDVTLNVNYDAPGFRALIEVYDQNPIVEGSNQKKEGLEPIYKAYTDINGKLIAKMYVPTAVKEAFLYTNRIGLPRCIKLQAEGNEFAFDATKTVTTTRAQSLLSDKLPFIAANPNGGTRADNLYSIVEWNANGRPEAKYITLLNKLGNESMGDITSRIGDFLNKQNVNTQVVGNKELITEPDKLNISMPQNVNNTKVSVTFIGDNGAFNNTLGYYYYPTNSPVTPANFYQQKKYVIFPNASNSSIELKSGHTVNLLYFDENGNSSEEFPGGYTIGWFLISDGYYFYKNEAFVKNIIAETYNIPGLYPSNRNTCFSNEIKTTNSDPRNFITVYDEVSKLFIVGIEDMMQPGEADDYMDVLFFVNTTPDVGKGDRPSITDPTVPEPKEETETLIGTLAFEDQWPKGGDYDMNDVVVEYKRIITFNQDNYVTGVEETFTLMQKPDAATFNNLFAYQVKDLGNIELPADCDIETATNSIVITKGVKQSKEESFTIKRTFEASAKIAKDDIKKDFNPYIIVNGVRGEGRLEVHLPKHQATILANDSQNSTEDDAYYIKKDGKFPFAIDIPVITFIAPQERKSIDSDSQYPLFRSWAESKGMLNTDWYNHYNGEK